ncbi:MAG: S9 family peptidase, partial [Candidatus Competibacteraceae bacterium]
DQNGDEMHQMYLLPARGGWAQPITNAMEAQHYVADWSPDSRTLAYAANDREPTNMDVILHDITTGDTRRPMPQGKQMYAISWSPDGHYLLVLDFHTNTDQDIYILNVATGEILHAAPHDGEGVFFPAAWANDSSGFYLRTSYQREFLGLAFYSMAAQKWEFVETPDHDIENVGMSKNGVLVWDVNDNGASKLHGRDLRSGKDLAMPELPLCVIGGMDINHDGTRLAITLARPTEAFNLYEVDLASGQVQALSQSMLGGIDPADMVEPQAVFFPSFDGRQIPAWLYRPRGAGQFPIVLSIHGGPEAQERTQYNYNGLYQYLLNRGFGVLAPNIRGSTGYGVSYQKLIHRDWGGAELSDIEHAAKYLRTLDWVDSNRIAVFGGSFGGFATLSAVTRLPQYWACAVDIVGPSNLLTFVKSVPPHWRPMMKEWVGDAEEDHAMLVERSPITYVDKIRVPLLVIQGAKDPRVVKAESDQMVERIRKNGGSVEYYVDENEGHGATRRENAIRWFQMVADYLENQLLDEPG